MVPWPDWSWKATKAMTTETKVQALAKPMGIAEVYPHCLEQAQSSKSLAVQNGDLAAVRAFLEGGVDVNSSIHENGNNLMQIASELGRADIVAHLVTIRDVGLELRTAVRSCHQVWSDLLTCAERTNKFAACSLCGYVCVASLKPERAASQGIFLLCDVL